MLWVPFKGELGLHTLLTQPHSPGLVTSSSMGKACNKILCNGSMLRWHQAWASRRGGIPGTGPQERLELLHLGGRGWDLIFPPLPILPLRDSCMGE